MRSSRDRILTSHAGSLPRPDALIEANRIRASGEHADEAQFQAQLRAAVIDVVGRQKELGIDLPGDGEFGKSMGHRVNYGAWWSYSFQRLSGLELSGPGLRVMPCTGRAPDTSYSRALAIGATAHGLPPPITIRNQGLPPARARLIRRSASGRWFIPAMPPSRPTSKISRRRLPPMGSRKCFHDLGGAGQRLAHATNITKQTTSSGARLRRCDARGA